ncbi:unnamed protein product [Pylaiella littoralis]
MKSEISWSDQVPERDDKPKSNAINDLCFSPDGSNLVVAVENRVLVYDAAEGELLNSLRGHKDSVLTVDYAKDGKHFASGGADHTVIIWTSEAEGVLKYTHNESILRLAYSPGTTKLASCTQFDFGLWRQEQKSVIKHKVHAKILSADWSPDGLHLALGFFDGHVGIRDADGSEKITITRCVVQDVLQSNTCDLKNIPCFAFFCVFEGVRLTSVCETNAWVWAVAGRPGHDELVVGCDGGSIRMHKLKFQHITAIHKDRYAYRENMSDVIVQHLISEQKVRIKCRDYVEQIAIFRDRLAVRLPDKVHVYELTQHDDKYDLRYRLKDKIHLPSSTPPSTSSWSSSALISSAARSFNGADRSKKSSRDSGSSQESLHGRGDRRSGSVDGAEDGSGGGGQNGGRRFATATFLLVTWSNVILCEGRVLQLYDFSGTKVREWILDAAVRSASVDGGPAGGEALLLGLESGVVLQVFVDNAFPVEVVKATAAVVCCAMSVHRRKASGHVAVVDSKSRVVVFDVLSKEVVFQESGATRVAFNTSLEDMLCYSGNGMLYVRTGSFPVQEQFIGGEVASYRGARVISLKGVALTTVDVPLTKTVYRHIEAREFKQAHAVACLGVTQRDWRILGTSALQAMEFEVGRKAFVRLRDLRLVDVLSDIEMRTMHETALMKSNAESRNKMEADASAELLAHQGNYQGAAKTWARNGMASKAITMFIDLRRWEDAKVFAASSGGSVDAKELTRRQAEWAEEIGDWSVASELFLKSGQPLRAAEITIKGRGEGWQDALADIVRSVTKTETNILGICGKEMSLAGFDDLAKEAYVKMDDFANVLALYVKNQNWLEAVKLSEEHGGKFDDSVFLPYALWLRDKGRFDEALEAFRKAGRRDLSGAMTAQLILNAVSKTRFDDASYYYWRSSREAYAAAEDEKLSSKETREAWALAAEHSSLADLYHAFHHVHSFTTDPFTDLQPEVLLQVSRFLVNSLGEAEPPRGISRAHTLYTLAKQAKVLGAFKLARFAYDRLQRQRVPPLWQDQIDLDMLTVQASGHTPIFAKPVRDSPDLFAACFRCGASNPLLSPFTAMSSGMASSSNGTGGGGRGRHASSLPWGDACTTCRHPFVRSFFNFESLPLVEFQPDPGLSDEDALELIKASPPQGGRRKGFRGGGRANQWREAKEGDADVMALGSDDDDDSLEGSNGGVSGDEMFNRCINSTLEAQEDSSQYLVVVVSAKCLRGLKREDVFRVPPGTCSSRAKLYKNMTPEIPLALSQPCGKFFHEEDFEFAYLKESRCPFSRVSEVGDYGSC